jgi:hypothetical protein
MGSSGVVVVPRDRNAMGRAVPYAIITAMAKRNPARPGETLKDVLVTLDHPVWLEYKTLTKDVHGDSASVRLRRYMAAEVRRMKRASNA